MRQTWRRVVQWRGEAKSRGEENIGLELDRKGEQRGAEMSRKAGGQSRRGGEECRGKERREERRAEKRKVKGEQRRREGLRRRDERRGLE